MTGRTHDLAAFAGLVIAFLYAPILPALSLSTVIVAFGANFLGALFPDIDQPTSDFWDNFRLGPFVAKVIVPALGGHRHISHSLAGVVLIGVLFRLGLNLALKYVLIDINSEIVWNAFMIGVVSHLVMDLPTKEGVPLLWPFDWKFGLPPWKALRITSGKFVEKFIVFPGLLMLTGYLLFVNQEKVLELLKTMLKIG
ncbi:MAG: hypothetical protein COY81_02740 [Candidatus Pacebacteria bacterium CG_4_10_14_0_8_um_filter_43_12]|nr:MAG: hypothetical protein COY81_02740 [Candidatus Pacebacteria bacterium CG_4_10_14_0_8_um_filter_43_12]